jgi:two-component system chemotaxis response regulator CheY
MTTKPSIKVSDEFPTKINFLVLEDMANIRQQLVSDLRSIGAEGEIFEAATVREAIQFCNEVTIHFIISDWNLPDASGHDFLKKIRANKKFDSVPFVMCTTINEVKNFLDAIASGANDYIVKPWEISELQKKISLTWATFKIKK